MNCDYCYNEYRLKNVKATHKCNKCGSYVCFNCIVYKYSCHNIGGVIYKNGRIYNWERGWCGIRPLRCNHVWTAI